MKFLCGTPKGECCGTEVMVNAGMHRVVKSHGSSKQAFNCYRKYLLSQGYEQVGSRELRSPPDKDGNRFIHVLTKQSKFGAILRVGKHTEAIKGNRYTPKRGKMAAGGTIISR